MAVETMDQAMARFAKELQSAQDAVAKKFTDAGLKITHKGYMGENIMMLFFDDHQWSKAKDVSHTLDKNELSYVMVTRYDNTQKIAIIF